MELPITLRWPSAAQEGMGANDAGTAYRFVASDGGVFCFGSSQFYGSAT